MPAIFGHRAARSFIYFLCARKSSTTIRMGMQQSFVFWRWRCEENVGASPSTTERILIVLYVFASVFR